MVILAEPAPTHATERLKLSIRLTLATPPLSEDGTTEIERYESLPGHHPDALRAICVVGRGYWFRSGDSWKTTAQSFEFAEVAAFIAGTLGLLQRVSVSRREPSLANYLFENGQMLGLDERAV